jgi:beta-glucanase (GH16 family)
MMTSSSTRIVGTVAVGAAIVLIAFGHEAALRSKADATHVLDLDKYHLTFEEDFSNFSVSAWGPNTRWIAHTPWHGDFGDAQFADPAAGFPFTVRDDVLRIEARRGNDGRWRSGLIASNDPQGRGFSQQFGYFEMRAKLPPGPGLWPAFWLIANHDPSASAEIDVLEHYGAAPDKYQSVVHVWPKTSNAKPYEARFQHSVRSGSLYEGFHTYGVDVESDWITFYFDRMEIARTETPAQHRQAMFLLVDLGLGGGWPIDQAPSPSYMYVSYIRAYQK